MENVLESYLVSLGFAVNQPELNKFKTALKDAGATAERHTSGIIGQFVKWQSVIVGSFAAVGLATVGMMDKVAQADLGFQVTAQKMFISTEAARRLSIATKELGYSLADIAWNPELRERFRELWGLQGTLEKQRPADFEQTMSRIRDVRFEFSKVSVILQNVAMQLSATLYKALGGDAFLAKLRGWVEWLVSHTPQITQWLASVLVPILKDAWRVLQDVWKVVEKLGEAFLRIIGAISGDKGLRDGKMNMENFGKAIDKAADYMVEFVDAVTSAELVVIDLFNALVDLAHLDFKGMFKDLGIARSDLTKGGATVFGVGLVGALLGIGSVGALSKFLIGAIRSLLGGAVEGVVAELGADGVAVAAGGTAAIASTLGIALVGLITGIVVQALDEKYGHAAREKLGLSEIPALNRAKIWSHLTNGKLSTDIGTVAGQVGIDPAIARGLVSVESNGDPNALGRMTPYGRAIGLTQLLPGTASELGVNPHDPAQNLYGGLTYLSRLLKKYGNNYDEALAAYNMGPGNMQKLLDAHGGEFSKNYLTPGVRDYVNKIESRAGWQVTMHNTIVVPPGTSPDQAKRIVSEGTQDALKKQQRVQLLNAGGIYG